MQGKNMVDVIPNVGDMQAFNCSKAASVLKVSRNLLRAKAENNLIVSHYDPDTGRRIFLGRDIKAYWLRRNGL